MKLAFFGTADFAVPALERLAPHIELVVTQPDRPSGRGLELRPSPVKSRAEELGLTVVAPVKCRTPEFVDEFRSHSFDASVVAAYGQILPVSLLEASRQGAINLHGSILPFYRGAAPIQRCILNGDSVTGVTLMQMDKGMDTGDVIAVEKTVIGAEETAGELFERLARMAGNLADEWMPRICAGDYPRTPQDDSLATLAPKVEKGEAELSFERSAKQEHDRYRAFTPHPGAFVRTRFGALRINKCMRTDGHPIGPGVVTAVRPNLTVSFSDGLLAFVEVSPEGKKRMGGSDFANGAHLSVGDCLTA
ncbi:MAG: methionyl-tRNA formyltransferase [Armatimonadetes bacterium]|nr:methionyl-tRNA formyltransferase [Armatimonadota bacterium]